MYVNILVVLHLAIRRSCVHHQFPGNLAEVFPPGFVVSKPGDLALGILFCLLSMFQAKVQVALGISSSFVSKKANQIGSTNTAEIGARSLPTIFGNMGKAVQSKAAWVPVCVSPGP